MKKLIKVLLTDLKVSAQTKTFWVSLLGTLILIGQFTWVTVLGGVMPAGVDGGLVTVGNTAISLLIAAGLIKNTNGEDLTAKQIAKEKEQAESLLNSLGISQEELKALAKAQMPEIKEEPKNEA
ncbi:hypothetical protein [Latilactobacillus curvatus]|uniref:hypothetical protein n=1 Tax=Latilactobacillus curvatus TaxID=28038 RepID=UPI00223A84BA|nr:hypothetical protein [Latilactobacillus curvatus]MCS8582360.1 hypothetical protein [Latilactobacillus curvatus]MCS8607030.1 hypothetical protein [Latilactobacillus curvatus]MCS8616763.1 hypothetical protein [Latilactobacillus curvatus]